MALRIDLNELADGRAWQISRAALDASLESAAVVLDRHHRSPTKGVLARGDDQQTIEVSWSRSSERAGERQLDATEATEQGAYAVAYGVLRDSVTFVARLEAFSGAEFMVRREGDPPRRFVRLAVSGLTQGSDRDVARHLRARCEQVLEGRSAYPGMVAVIRFHDPSVALAEVG